MAIRADDVGRVIPPPLELESEEERATPASTGDTEAPQSRGFLLDADEAEVAAWIEREVQRRTKAMQRRVEISKACRAWRKGHRFVQVRHLQDDNVQVWVAPSTGAEPPAPNKCDQLVRRIVATLMVDPPQPECVPASGDEIDRDASEFSARALEHEMERMGYLVRHEDAIDKSFTYSSAFEYFCVDPYSAQQPVEVLAHPLAQSVEPDPRINPLTQQIEPPFVLRYVREDGTLTDDKGEAKQQWVPGIKMKVLKAPHVHFLPEYSSGVEDAEGVIICYPETLGALRSQFEQEDAPWSLEVLRELASYRPPLYEELLPRYTDRSTVLDQSRWKGGVPPDDQMCFPYLVYMRKSVSYPEGAYVLSVGKSRVLYRGEWQVEFRDQQDNVSMQALPIPVAQVRNLDDHQDDDPYGTSLTLKLGEMDEIRAIQIGGWLDWLDRFNHPREYLPLGSIIQPDDLNRRDGSPIIYNPEGQPHFENVAPFPAEAVQMLQFMTSEMDQEASMAGATGETSANITSGYQQRQVIEQALVGLSGIKRNADAAFTRGMQIILHLMRYYTTTQRIGYVSESGRYKEDEWSAADLGSTKDVKIRRGTSTMMAASAKQALARDDLEISLKAGDPMAYTNYRRALASNADSTIWQDDDPIRMRVRQQIHEWQEGPSDEVKSAPPPQALPPIPDPNTGQLVQQPPPPHPMTIAAQRCFGVLPIDIEPLNARIRHEELSAAIASARFGKHPPEWQQGMLMAYEAARVAAGVMTLAEQQQAAMQQQQAEQQKEVEKEQRKSEAKMREKEMEAEFERQQREQDQLLKSEADRQRMAVAA